MDRVRDYYGLTKPGIIRGNVIVALAGYFFASRQGLDVPVGIGVLVGLSLAIASACVVNNIIDRGIDKKMARTKNRAIPSGRISVRAAAIYGAMLGVSGIVILVVLTNVLTAAVAAFGWVAYVWFYGVGKRKTVHGTVVGSISGAVPPVVGYAAVTNTIDIAAILLFLILVCWQMPHFYAIAMYRSKDYAAASIPVLPIKKGMSAARFQTVLYVGAFIVSASLQTIAGYAGYVYLIVMLTTGSLWLGAAVKKQKKHDDVAWAKGIFRYSLVVLLIFSAAISLDPLLP